MFILYAVVIGLIVGRLTGGRVERLGDIRFHWAWLAFAAVVVQLVLFLPLVADALAGAQTLAIGLYVGTTAVVLGVVVRNIRLTGLPIVALGACLNLVAILANGGVMPATPEALAAAGLGPETNAAFDTRVVDPALPWLVDRFALPSWLPLANVFSVGDVLIGIGIAVAVAAGMHARRRPSTAATAPQ
ncbi:MAG: DUF5317 domain-containing protein [Candidatus Limnocylindrales bacterium]